MNNNNILLYLNNSNNNRSIKTIQTPAVLKLAKYLQELKWFGTFQTPVKNSQLKQVGKTCLKLQSKN